MFKKLIINDKVLEDINYFFFKNRAQKSSKCTLKNCAKRKKQQKLPRAEKKI